VITVTVNIAAITALAFMLISGLALTAAFGFGLIPLMGF
jgi:hypothetical protein